MKDLKAYVSAPVVFEWLADDGWPEDAGWWPERIGGPPLHSFKSEKSTQKEKRFSVSQFLKSLLSSRKSK
jgi:hypothetical protein